MRSLPVRLLFICSAALLLAGFAQSLFAEAGPLPEGFAERVESGWLPPLNVNPSTSMAPLSGLPVWAHPYARGRTRVLFLCDSQKQYEIVELCRAFDLDGRIIPVWGVPGGNQSEQGIDPDNTNLLRYYLTKDAPEVIVASSHPGALPADIQDRISELVHAGTGLIWALPGIIPRIPEWMPEPSPVLDPLFPLVIDRTGYKVLSRSVRATGNHQLSLGVPFDQMRWCSNVESIIRAGAFSLLESEQPGRVLAACWEQGRGRVVTYNRAYQEFTFQYPLIPVPFPLEVHTQLNTLNEESWGKTSLWLEKSDFARAFYLWFGKAILWAAKREPLLLTESIETSADGRSFKIVLRDTMEQERRLRLAGTVRSGWGSRKAEFEKKWMSRRGAGESLVITLPDTGMVGEHTVDFYIFNDDGLVENFGSFSVMRQGLFSASLAPDFSVHEPTEKLEVEASIICKTPERKTGEVCFEALDTDGRLLGRSLSTIDIAGTEGKNFKSILDLSACPAVTRLVNLRAVVTIGGESLELRDQISVRQAEDWDDVHFAAYGAVSFYCAPFDRVSFEQFKAMGFDTLMDGFLNAPRLRLLAETGMRPLPNNVSLTGAAGTAQLCAPFSPVGFELQDEPELLFAPSPEGGWDDPDSLKAFADWLQKKYGSLEALNKAWDTEYGGWGEVRRFRWWEVAGQANWTPWFDSRRHLDTIFPDRFGAEKDLIEKINTTGKYFWVNARSITPFAGFDPYLIIARLGSAALYTDYASTGNVGYLELANRWVKDGILHTCIGYTWPSSPGKERITREAWFALTRGARSLAWFAPQCDETPPQGRFSFLEGDLVPNVKGEIIAEVNKKILGGAGKIIATSTPVKDGVLILHSRPSIYAKTLAYLQAQRQKDPERDPATIKGPDVWYPIAENSFVTHLRALGYQYEFVSEKELTPETLESAKAICLSNVYCLSNQHLKLLVDFVRKGGCVLAEAGTGLRDEDGRLYEKSSLAFRELFGFERTEPIRMPKIAPEAVALLDAQKIETSDTHGNLYQKGNAFYFNFYLNGDYPTCMLIKNALEKAGVSPTFALQDNPIQPGGTGAPVAELAAFRRGDLMYLVLLADGNMQDDAFCIRLPEVYEAYEVLEGKELGRIGKIEGHIHYGEVKMFALSDSPVREISMQLDRKAFKPGDAVRVSISLSAHEGNGGDRVIALSYSFPQGAVGPAVPRTVVLEDGRTDFLIHLPLNAGTGLYKMTARDLSSGAEATAEFQVVL